MPWLFTIRELIYPKEKCVWAKVRILHETDKAILVDNGSKFWLPKSRIFGVRLRNNHFEVCAAEQSLGSG